MSYSKTKKKDLIKIIEKYEQVIEELENGVIQPEPEKEIIVINPTDDKTITYIKKRLSVVKGNLVLSNMYKRELDRLLSYHD